MDPLYESPMTDEAEAMLGYPENRETRNSEARRVALDAYTKAMNSAMNPFYQRYGLPMGKGLKKKITAKYLMKYGVRIPKHRLYSKLNSKLKGMGATKEQRAIIKQKRDLYLASLGEPERTIELEKMAKKKSRAHQYYINRKVKLGLPLTVNPEARSAAMKARWQALKSDPVKYDAYRENLKAKRAAAIDAAYNRLKAEVEVAPEPTPSASGLTRSQWKIYKANLEAKLAAMTPEEIAEYNMKVKNRAGKSKAARMAYKEKLRLPGNEDLLAKYKAKRKASAKAYRERLKAEMASQGSGMMDKLMKYKSRAALGDPEALSKLESLKQLINGGMTSARGGLTQARGCRGGALGLAALSSAALPLIMEGMKWVGKRIGERSSTMGNGIEDGIWLDEITEGDSKPPKNASNFWKRVYNVASTIIPMRFRSRKQAEAAANEFIAKHAQIFFNNYKDKVLAKRKEIRAPLTEADILEPVVVAEAEKAGVSPSEASEILSVPELQKPAGEGFLDKIISVFKSPAVKGILSTGAKMIMPGITKKISKFADGRMTSLAGKHPGMMEMVQPMMPVSLNSMQPITEEVINEDAQEPILATVSSEPSEQVVSIPDGTPLPVVATASGLGAASADAFTRGGRLAARVYSMAKKTP